MSLEMISLATAVTLTNLSKRTLWRRISDGSLTRSDEESPSDKAMIHFDDIRPWLSIELAEEDLQLLANAEAGDEHAQTDLAIVLLSQEQPKNACYWLRSAAKKSKNAMYLLGRCYIDGNGVEKNDNLGIMWIAKAADSNCLIAKEIIQFICDKATNANTAKNNIK